MVASESHKLLLTIIVTYVATTVFTLGDNAFGNEASKTHIVEIENLEFSPKVVNVRLGDTIKWINRDIIPHTATADDRSWNSDHLSTADEWSVVVTKEIFREYFCIYHPSMKGKIALDN